MHTIEYTDAQEGQWETVSEGVERMILRAKPGENRVLITIAAGSSYPHHSHAVPDEVFVAAGTYADPNVEGGREFGVGSYLYYPAGTAHHATSPTGCTILVWNANNPAKQQEE